MLTVETTVAMNRLVVLFSYCGQPLLRDTSTLAVSKVYQDVLKAQSQGNICLLFKEKLLCSRSTLSYPLSN